MYMLRMLGVASLLPLAPCVAQSHDHGAHSGAAASATSSPREAGQSAFAAIAEVVAMLEADPKTDWSKVNIEALRRHLIIMDRVFMESAVTSRDVPGGIEITAVGVGAVESAIQEMLQGHAGQLQAMPELSAAVVLVQGGAKLTVTAARPDDQHQVRRIRGLGFGGLLALGNHHGPHHLNMARGQGH